MYLDNNIFIIPHWVPTANNKAADTLSRTSLQDYVRVHPTIISIIEKYCGKIMVDRFATSSNAVVKSFNSYFYEPGCTGVDAFAQTNWMEGLNYVYPPLSCIGRTLYFLCTHYPLAKVAFIAPKWRAQPWFRELRDKCE